VNQRAASARLCRTSPTFKLALELCVQRPPSASTDFTGYWVLSKTENMDEFFRALGFPWVLRKAALKFGAAGVDIVAHTGPTLRVTSLNVKGSWTRTYDTSKPVTQPDAAGASIKTTAMWEGSVLRSRSEGSQLGTCESWRYRRSGVMVVKTSVFPPGGGAEATMFWFFERMGLLESHLAVGGRAALLRRIAADQKRVGLATERDNAYLQRVALDWALWRSPADEFIFVASPGGSAASLGGRGADRTPGRRTRPPADATSPTSGSVGDVTPSESSAATGRPLAASRRSEGSGSKGRLDGVDSTGSLGFGQEISLTLPGHPPRPPLPPGAAAAASAAAAIDITFPHAVPVLAPTGQPTHRRVGSADSNAGGGAVRRGPAHLRSPSEDSLPSYTPGRNSPLPYALAPPTAGEALLAYKAHEFLDSSGILAVIPVGMPNDTHEPQLLNMSPEQAEEAAAKLRELETELMLKRQETAKGLLCCGLVITKEKHSLPEHLRVWEMTLS
jgi:hypothetical protein